MENIFKDAYMGKAYKTKDGRRVVIEALFPDTGAYLISEDRINDKCFGHNIHAYRLDGISKDCSELDIVSEWQEPIDEEKLDDLAYDICNNKIKGEQGFVNDDIEVLIRGFKYGYREKDGYR